MYWFFPRRVSELRRLLHVISIPCVTVLVAVSLAGCGGGGLENVKPSVDAGDDQLVEPGAQVALSGLAEDEDGEITRVEWQQLAGPDVVLESVSLPDTSFVAPSVAESVALRFSLTAWDDEDAATSDEVLISVAVVNSAPTVTGIDIPPDASGEIPISVQVSDSEGDAVTIALEWSINGRDWQPATVVAAPQSVLEVTSTPHTVTWDSLTDLGFRDPRRVWLRVTPSDALAQGETVLIITPLIDNLLAAVDNVDHYTAFYGALDEEKIREIETNQLAILHPAPNPPSVVATRQQIADVQDGVDPNAPGDDVLVLCYVSVGEDLRTVNLSDEQMAADPRFVGDLAGVRGPRVDPRGPTAYTESLPITDTNLLGLPSPGGSAFASWYLDDASLANGGADGLPDRNTTFGGAYVNAGDPAWFDTLNNMLSSQGDPPGLKEVLTTDVGLGLGCDGLFMDTFDMAAPNTFADSTKFEWTAPGFQQFVQRVRNAYPSVVLLQNRGLFFFNPNIKHHAYTTKESIDLVMFESYRLDANPDEDFNARFFCDNKRNIAPVLSVAATFGRQLKILSLGYAEGPEDSATGARLTDTLVGDSTFGLQVLTEDVSEAQAQQGYRHYLTNAQIDLLNGFVRTQSDFTDVTPPVWSSTFNDQSCDSDESPDVVPTPRVGVQEIVPGLGSVTLRWDVALDLHRVEYVVYYQDQPFDFDALAPLGNATRRVLTPAASERYSHGTGPDVFPFEALVSGLASGVEYYFLIRAVDRSTRRNEDANQVVLSSIPL